MYAALTYAAGDQSLRFDGAIRRKAENAYERHVQYNGENQKTVKELKALLADGRTNEAVRRQDARQLDAGQVKQVALPLGKTLEETIDIWRDVRREAISEPEPQTADYQLAATASAKIRKTEAQIALNERSQSEIGRAAAREEAESLKTASMEFPSTLDGEVFSIEKRYEQAISSYSFHVQMKQKGFEVEWPRFYRTA